MHSFLIVGTNPQSVEREIDKLVKRLKLTIMSFEIVKINDVRELSSLTKLTLNSPTAIVVRDIQRASIAALNALLKSLEEPQESIHFILTCSNHYSLPETIISRCQIIAAESLSISKKELKQAAEFLELKFGEKIAFIDKIRTRQEALDFVTRILYSTHQLTLKPKADRIKLANIIRSTTKTHQAIGANGNIQLQLTRFLLSLV